jgi:hypothetical protein
MKMNFIFVEFGHPGPLAFVKFGDAQKEPPRERQTRELVVRQQERAQYGQFFGEQNRPVQ